MKTYTAVLVIAVAMVVGPCLESHAASFHASATGAYLSAMASDLIVAAVGGAGFQPGFSKVYRKRIGREIVWFDGREADLEHHAKIMDGRVYITLTDLARHLGCAITWGPSNRYIEVSRGDMTVVVCPKRCRGVKGTGCPCDGWPPAVQRGGVTWVPVEPFATFFGATVAWNPEDRRLEVATKPAE
jgi:hypothetical protein